jgi:hypothetical protein
VRKTFGIAASREIKKLTRSRHRTAIFFDYHT